MAVITFKMWKKALNNHILILERLKKRNDFDDIFHIKEHERAIKEIKEIIKTNKEIKQK